MNGNPVVLFVADGFKTWGKGHYHCNANGAHAALLSRYNPKTNNFTVNDPLSHNGPIHIKPWKLMKFLNADEGAGVGVILKD